MRNAVYSLDKAIEIKAKLEILGENWFNFKEQLKGLKLHEAPKINNPKLLKPLPASKQSSNLVISSQKTKSYQDVEILMKLIPYFDIPLALSKRIKPEANSLRKLLSLAKSEAEMIQRRLKHRTILDLI